MSNARSRALGVCLLIGAACTVESSRPPVTAGDGVTVDGKTQTVGIDAAKVPIQDAPCATGEVLAKTETGWGCRSIPVVSEEHIPTVAACEPGQIVARTASGWACILGPDVEKTPQVLACAEGLFVRKTATGWTCAPAFDPEKTPVVETCRPGEVVTRGPGGWTCAPAIDPTATPVVPGCPAGQVVTGTGDGFACAPAFDPTMTPVVPTCAPGQIVSRTSAGWACIAQGPDPLKTPVIPACAPGQYVRRTASGWECTPLVGDLTGNVVGNVLGNVSGNVTGDTAGKHTGAVVGNVTGNLTGDTTGKHTGNVVGNVLGNVSGNVTGDTNGKHTGAVVGDVTGNLTGNVTGNVNGTAVNVTGVVTVPHGGTGATSFVPGNLLQMGSGGAFQGFAPGANGTLVGVVGGQFASVVPADAGFVVRTGAVTNVYVRPGGSDQNCNGSADVDDAPAARPSCAVASPQAALDRLPDVIHHSALVNIAPGTYRIAPGGIGLDIAKIVRGTASLTIRGSGAVGTTIITGDNGASGLALRGLYTAAPVDGLTIANLSFDHFADSGLRIARSSASISNVSVTAGVNGLVCERASNCSLFDTDSFSSGSNGLYIGAGAKVWSYGALTLSNDVGYGIYAEGASTYTQSGSLTVVNAGAQAMFFTGDSVATVTGNVSASCASHGVFANAHSVMSFSGQLNITVTGAGAYAVVSSLGSYIAVAVPAAGDTWACTAAQATGNGTILSQYGSQVFTGGAGPLTVNNCNYGLIAYWYGFISDDATGTRTLNNVPGPVGIALQSSYGHGHWPAPTNQNCSSDSTCL